MLATVKAIAVGQLARACRKQPSTPAFPPFELYVSHLPVETNEKISDVGCGVGNRVGPGVGAKDGGSKPVLVPMTYRLYTEVWASTKKPGEQQIHKPVLLAKAKCVDSGQLARAY